MGHYGSQSGPLSTPLIADGKLYARSMSEIASVAIRPQTAAAPAETAPGLIPGSDYAAFVAQVNQSTDKRALIDEYLAAQSSFPLIEADTLAHFIYSGPGQEVALAGDLFGHRFDRAMHRVADTDLFYYSARFEPDARISYRFIVDQQATPDPRNPRSLKTMHFGHASQLAMPGWRAPGHLTPRADDHTGRIDTLHFDGKTIEVYLPPGLDPSDARYPVVYYHGVATICRWEN